MTTAMHWIWAAIVFGCLAWYACTALYIAVKGAFDIQSLLEHLRPKGDQADSDN